MLYRRLGSFQGTAVQQRTSAPAKQEEDDEEDDDDIDLFGSDDDDDEAAKLKEQRLKEYAEKKAKKPSIIAKSSILLDVKPVSLSTCTGDLPTTQVCFILFDRLSSPLSLPPVGR